MNLPWSHPTIIFHLSIMVAYHFRLHLLSLVEMNSTPSPVWYLFPLLRSIAHILNSIYNRWGCRIHPPTMTVPIIAPTTNCIIMDTDVCASIPAFYHSTTWKFSSLLSIGTLHKIRPYMMPDILQVSCRSSHLSQQFLVFNAAASSATCSPVVNAQTPSSTPSSWPRLLGGLRSIGASEQLTCKPW